MGAGLSAQPHNYSENAKDNQKMDSLGEKHLQKPLKIQILNTSKMDGSQKQRQPIIHFFRVR